MAEKLDDLRVFLLVAETGSFTKAAAQLGVSQSALSYTVRQLEERLQIKLLERTTRSVSTTAAGEQLREQIIPLFAEFDAKIENLTAYRGTLGGSLKITGNEHALTVALWDKFARAYPDVALELDCENRFADIVAERFDAGIRLGEFVEKDMIAVRVSPDLVMTTVAAPELLSRIDMPETPHDLAALPCLNLRLPTLGNTLPWEFCDPQSGKTVKIQPAAGFTANQNSLLLQAARAALGIAWLPRDMVSPELASGALVEILPDWAIRYEGYYLYYPSRRAESPLFQALIAALRED
jgi:Transcriptional regulator